MSDAGGGGYVCNGIVHSLCLIIFFTHKVFVCGIFLKEIQTRISLLPYTFTNYLQGEQCLKLAGMMMENEGYSYIL